MGFIPLLPQTNGKQWPHQDTGGIHSISDRDYQRNLCENYYDASSFGTPSPVARAIVFSQRLERYIEDLQNDEPSKFEDTFDLWSLLLKGIYFNLISFRKFELEGLRELGKIIKSELPEDFEFSFLEYNGEVIGFTYPNIGFVPSVRLGQSVIDQLKNEINRRDVEKASEYFVGWVHTFDNMDQQNILFYTLLYSLANKWNPKASTKLELEIDILFETGPHLWLASVKNDDEQEVALPMIPIYIGTPLICDNCGYQIGKKESALEVHSPDHCRCPNCSKQQNWLEPYSDWISYNDERGCYLIYAFKNSPVRKAPFSNYVTFEKDGITIQSGQLNLKIFGLIFSEENLKCTRLLFFKDGNKVQTPHLPIRGEYFGSVRIAKMERNPHIDRLTKDYVVTLEVDGWDEVVTLKYKSDEIETEEALLLSWPNFKLKDWKIYYYLLDSTPQMNQAGLSMRALTHSGAPKLLTANKGQIIQDVDAFEVVFAKKDKNEIPVEVKQQCGVYMLAKSEIEKGETPLTVAFDFGTSSSMVYYRLGEGKETLLRFNDFTETIVNNRILSDGVLENSNWLPTYRIDDNETAWNYYRAQVDNDAVMPATAEEIIDNMNYYIPSQMIVKKPFSVNLERPLDGYRLCHAYATLPEGEVIYEMKTMEVGRHPEGRYSYDQVVSRYLEMSLILSLASIIKKEERTGYLVLRASFPRMFDNAKLNSYLKCLEKTLIKIEGYTGIRTQKKYYTDESRAAAYSMPIRGGMALVMDLGGGTTDIGIFERKDDKLEPVFIESLNYGGNAYLRLLAETPDLFPKPNEKTADPLLWLLRETRMRSFETLVNTQYSGNKKSKNVALDLLLRFYSPITYYVKLLFDALAVHRKEEKDYKAEEIVYYLVGNGWSLADAIPPIDGSYSRGHKEIVRYLLESQGFTNLISAGEPVFSDNLKTWPGPKAAVGYGMIKAREKDLYPSVEDACNGNEGIKSIIGFDIQIEDGSNNLTPIAWHNKIPLEMKGLKYNPALSKLVYPKDWSFINYNQERVAALEELCAKDIEGAEKPRITRSVIARFIETIYLKQIDNDRRI